MKTNYNVRIQHQFINTWKFHFLQHGKITAYIIDHADVHYKGGRRRKPKLCKPLNNIRNSKCLISTM